jgi:hypothetical protein
MHTPHAADAGDSAVDYALTAGVIIMAVVLVALATPLEERLARLLGF